MQSILSGTELTGRSGSFMSANNWLFGGGNSPSAQPKKPNDTMQRLPRRTYGKMPMNPAAFGSGSHLKEDFCFSHFCHGDFGISPNTLGPGWPMRSPVARA